MTAYSQCYPIVCAYHMYTTQPILSHCMCAICTPYSQCYPIMCVDHVYTVQTILSHHVCILCVHYKPILSHCVYPTCIPYSQYYPIVWVYTMCTLYSRYYSIVYTVSHQSCLLLGNFGYSGYCKRFWIPNLNSISYKPTGRIIESIIW